MGKRSCIERAAACFITLMSICFTVYAASQDTGASEQQSNDPEVYKISRCQKILTKIDKLTLEVKQLKNSSKKDKKQHGKHARVNATREKIITLNKQIARYKIEAKSICDKNLLTETPWKSKAKDTPQLEEKQEEVADNSGDKKNKTSN